MLVITKNEGFDLNVHTGGFTSTFEEVAATHTPAPTETYTPISHEDAYLTVARALDEHGYGLLQSGHALARGGKRYFGLIEARRPVPSPNGKLYTTIIGVRNSHDKSIPFGLVAGNGVHVCSNLAFTGEIEIAKRHVKHFDAAVPALIDEALARLGHTLAVQDERMNAYMKTNVKHEAYLNDLLVRLYEAKVFPITNLPHIKREYLNPSFREFAARENLWRVLNAITFVRKGADLFYYAKDTMQMEAILDEEAGFSAPPFKP